MFKRIFLLAVLILVKAATLFSQPVCNFQVKTYQASCKGAADGKAEIWKDGQLIVLKPNEQELTCAIPEQPTLICNNIPASASKWEAPTGQIVINNQTVYLTAQAFNGSIQFDGGGTLVICRDATITNINWNTSQPIVINVNGNTKVLTPNLNLNSNVTMTNYGDLTFNGAGLNGKLYNHGTLTSDDHFSVNSVSGVLYNTKTMTFKKDLNIDGNSVFTNNGTTEVWNYLHNNGGAAIINNCKITVKNTFDIDAPCRNAGVITVTNTTGIKYKYQGGEGSLLKTGDLMVAAVAEGIGNNCSSIKVSGLTNITGAGSLQGKIDLCRGTGTFTQNGLITPPASANCSCTPTTSGGTTTSSTGYTGTITWSAGTSTLSGSTVTDLPAGTYKVKVLIDGCKADSFTFTIAEPPALTVTATINTSKVATVTASGGNNQNYSYQWSDGISGSTTGSFTRNFGTNAPGTYCVTVKDSKGCTGNTSCVVVPGQNDTICRIKLEYLATNKVFIDGTCPCSYQILNAENQPVATSITIPRPCQDSIVQLINCAGKRTTLTIEGKKNGCSVCPDPNNPACQTCPNPNNPVCCANPPCCNKELNPDCGTCPNPQIPCEDLTIEAIETPPSCNDGGKAVLTVSGGDGHYTTTNPVNSQSGLIITGLPLGQTVITVYDGHNKIGHKTVTIPEKPRATVTVIPANDPMLAVNNSFSLQLTNAVTGPYDIDLGIIAPFKLTGVQATGTVLNIGPFNLPASIGNGPFPVKITDRFCTEYNKVVYRSYCPDPLQVSYVPNITELVPSAKGNKDGSLILTNLPAGYSASWSGDGFYGNKNGATLSNIGVGSYSLVLKNNTTGCILSFERTLKDGKSITITVTPSGNCNYGITGSYKDADGNVLSTPLPSTTKYAWYNPFNQELLSVASTYNVKGKPLLGKPTYLRVETTDGNGNTTVTQVELTPECYPPCHPLDPTCCPDPNDPNCSKAFTVTYSATAGKCGQKGRVDLTVIDGGAGTSYRTSNTENDQTGLTITELSSGPHTITVYDANNSTRYVPVNVFIPETPKSEVNIVNSQNPSLGVNETFSIVLKNTSTGPYSISFEGFDPYYIPNINGSNGNLGTYQVPTNKGNGPFIVTVIDSYCNKYPLEVFRNIVYCTPEATGLNYVPEVSVNKPSREGAYDGSLAITNLPLPSGAKAIWTGTGFQDSRQGTSISGLPAGSYSVIIKKDAENCISYYDSNREIILKDGPAVNTSWKLVISGSGCKFTLDAAMVDCKGNILSTPLPSNLTYRWINPFTNATVFTGQTIDLSTITLTGYPTYLKVEVLEGQIHRAGEDFVIPVNCRTVVPPCPSKLEYTFNNPDCANGDNGSISVKPVNGGYIKWVTPSIINGNEYAWDKTGLKAGNYEVQLYGAECTIPASVKIGLIDPPSLIITKEDNGTRSVKIHVENGSSPYSYRWFDLTSTTSNDVRNELEPGKTYKVEVTDVKGCKDTLEFVYDPCAANKPEPYAVYTEAENMVTIIPNGGVEDYDFFWTKATSPQLVNQFGGTKFDLPEDTYTINVTDANGCSGITTYTHPGCGSLKLNLNVETKDATYSNVCDGKAVIKISNITDFKNYIVLWDKQDILELLKKDNGLRAIQDESVIRIFNACSGLHEVFVGEKGVNGICAIRKEFIIKGPEAPGGCKTTDLSINPINGTTFTKSCNMAEKVNINFEVTGGTPDYAFDWEFKPDGSSDVITSHVTKPGYNDAQPGSYSVKVTDTEGCFKTRTFTVNGSPSTLTATDQVMQPTCAKGTGDATVTPSGGKGQKSINWDDDIQIHTFTRTGLKGGTTFYYTVTDEASCTYKGSVTVDNVSVTPSFDTDTMKLCSGKEILLAAPYRGQYDIKWSSPTTGVSIPNPGADMISVKVNGMYILTRNHKIRAAQCPPIVDTVVVIGNTNCTPTSNCEVYQYELPDPIETKSCNMSMDFAAKAAAMKHYEDYIEGIKNDFTNQYVSNVMGSLTENLKMSFTDNEQHYTLYYYDQAGNLVRTVPPEGVKALDDTKTAALDTYWQKSNDNDPSNNPTSAPNVVTEHILATTYKYNSLNQLISQDMPDHEQQDLWDAQNSFNVPGGITVSTLDARGNKVWAFANGNDQTYLYSSADAGKSFNEGLKLNLGNILDIQRAGATGEVYFAVGTSGLILKAPNGTANWTLMQGPTKTDLVKVHFTDQNTGFIIDKSGNIWKTSNGGGVWLQVSVTSQYLQNMPVQLTQELTGKSIADIKVRDNKIYITANANDGSAGHLYVSTDLTTFAFLRQAYRINNLSAVSFDGTNTSVIAGSNVFKNATGNLVFDKRINLSSTVEQYITNGSLHVVKSSGTFYKSTDGINFSTIGNNISSAATILNSNGKIIIYEGQTVYSMNTDGSLTNLLPGNTSNVSGYYFNGSKEYIALANNVIFNRTDNRTYNLTTNNIQYFSTFVVQGNVALLYANNNITAVRLGLTTVAPIQPIAVVGNVLNNFKDVKRVGNINDGKNYAVNSNNQFYPITVNDGGATPQISVVSTAENKIEVDYQYGARSFAFGSSVKDYTYVTYENKVIYVAGGNPGVELKHQPQVLNATSLGNDNNVFAASDKGVLYKYISGENILEFNILSNNSENLTAATITSDNKLRVVSNTNKVYKVNLTNNVYSAAEEVATPAIGASVKSLSYDYLLTTDGRVFKATNNNNAGVITSTWSQEAGVSLTDYNVINGSNPSILAGGNNARISYKTTSWSTIASMKVQPINDVDVSADGKTIVAVGKQGTIILSTDGGANFTPVLTPNTGELSVVALYGNGFITGGSDGKINYYANGITSTEIGVGGTTVSGGQRVNKLFTPAPGKIYALRGREVLYSLNGASFTVALTSTSGKDLNDMTLSMDGYGFVTGNLGAAYRILPSGMTEEADGAVITPVSFADGLVSKLMPTDSKITDDQGTGIPPTNLRSVTFKDRMTGYITGSGGTVLKTIDGGYHWKPEGQYSSSGTPLIALTGNQSGVYSDAQNLGVFRDRSRSLGSRFWYDEVGRLVLSQNVKQYNISQHLGESLYENITVPGTGPIRAYSYTLYDKIGRIVEVGELLTRRPVDTLHHESQVKYEKFEGLFVSSGKKIQITRTYYDRVKFSNISKDFVQENLRPRVASVTYQDKEGTNYDKATHYSYDIHGNVQALVQEIKSEGTRLIKRLDYDYDLLSGKVNYVYYQKGESDQLIHKYIYDGDNRITEVNTSTDGVVWTQDVHYDYYAHGPLARTTIGKNGIEVQNYAYTLQGWIKGVKGDQFGYSLGYFDNAGNKDYSAIGSDPTAGLLSTPIAVKGTKNTSLYNGNIATWSSLNKEVNYTLVNNARVYNAWTQQFEYDQLNRIVSGKSLGMGSVDAFKNIYTYDASGNIKTLHRFNGAGTQFDLLNYNYKTKDAGYLVNTNKLLSVSEPEDLVPVHATDVDNQSDIENYGYDEIGNLNKDTQEEISSIEWNVYGKIKAVKRLDGSDKSDLAFEYDASGNRIVKIVTDKDGNISKTFYIRDAQGNVMSTYEIPAAGSLTLNEQFIYGSSRLGVLRNEVRSYELTDHLGNIRSVVGELRDVNNQVEVISANDYYPFGMIAKAFNSQNYRYGFNGKEKDDEIKGSGNSLDFGVRMYDSRLGCFFSVDPDFNEYEYQSPYVYAGNSPIKFTDVDGEGWGDVALGFVVSTVTNVVPGASLVTSKVTREFAANFATNLDDYNNALEAADNAYAVTGAAMTGAGMGMMGTGGTLALSGVGAAPGGVVVVGGGTVALAGASTTLNASINKSHGYEYGKDGKKGGGSSSSSSSSNSTTSNKTAPANKTTPSGQKTQPATQKTNSSQTQNKPTQNANKVNGNSKSSTKAQHNYDIVDTHNNNAVVKTGTSGGKETKGGVSYRGSSQANKWNKQEGTPGRYKSETTNRVPAGNGAREKALDYEVNKANQNRSTLDPNKHQKP